MHYLSYEIKCIHEVIYEMDMDRLCIMPVYSDLMAVINGRVRGFMASFLYLADTTWLLRRQQATGMMYCEGPATILLCFFLC